MLILPSTLEEGIAAHNYLLQEELSLGAAAVAADCNGLCCFEEDDRRRCCLAEPLLIERSLVPVIFVIVVIPYSFDDALTMKKRERERKWKRETEKERDREI